MMFTYHALLVLFLIFLVFFLSSFTIFSGLVLLLIIIIILYYIFFKKQSFYKYFFLLLVFTFTSLVNINFKKDEHINIENVNLKVVETYPNYLIVQEGWEKYYLLSHYYINNMQYTINAQLDDTLIFKGQTKDLKTINNFYEFDFKLFLNANNVNKQIVVNGNKVKVVFGKTLRTIFFNYINTFPKEIKTWTKLLLLFGQQTEENKSIFTIFNKFGITPIIVVSGLHINFFFVFLKKSFWFIKNQLIKLLICFVILCFYLYLLNWFIAAMKALFFLIFSCILKFNKKIIHPISILSFSAYCCLYLWPLQFYLLGFQLSFGITFLILFINNKFKKYSYWIRMLLINFVLFLFTILIQWQINHGFSLLTVAYLLFFTPIIIFCDVILFLNLFLNSILSFFVSPILNFLIIIIKLINMSNIWIPTFKIEIWILQLYFLILIVIYNCWRYFNWRMLTVIIINFVLLSTLWMNSIIKPYYELTMINVGSAMSFLITSPYNKSAILIDSGTEDLKPNNPTIYNYLSAKGIYSLKAVFLTHHDLDHISNIGFLKMNLKIDKIYENINQLSQYVIDGFNPIHNLVYGFNLQYVSENNKSLVLLLKVYNYKILFTGDIEEQTENLLVNTHVLSKINILQVPHHGSKTSSTISFLKTLNSELALISGHYQKRRQFPNIETLNNLKKINAQVYYSGKNKTVIIRIYMKHYDIITLI
ncbi:ComEC/Rec2 family competence protein [Spiroplasma endosymbiont of Lasioglossum villosulum]|uniref:ComEC/Rec2 family competence protein n=1 Tax=Spiroplasma endosymbiont of Lasioglossum villosulum TaxID=3066320 RepID=UPI0030CDC6F0